MKPTNHHNIGITQTCESSSSTVPVSVECLSRPVIWLEEKETWDSWCAQATHPSFFRTADWLQTWWEIYGAEIEPWILRVRDGDSTVIGYAPLMRITRTPLPGLRVRSIEFIGTGERVCPDYLDVIAPPGKTDLVRGAVCDYLRENRDQWDRLWLSDGLAQNSLSSFATQRTWDGCATRTVYGSVCPYLNFPADWETFLAGLRRHMRRKVRQIGHRIERELPVKWRVHLPDDDPKQAVTLMADLHTGSRLLKGESGNFVDKQYRQLHTTMVRRAARSGRLYLCFLELGQKPAAFFYGFLLGNRFFNYQTGFNPDYACYRPGWYAIGRMIQDLMGRGCGCIDFLRGDHDYKWHWANGWFETITGTVFSRSLSGHLSKIALSMRQRIQAGKNRRTGPPDFARERLGNGKEPIKRKNSG